MNDKEARREEKVQKCAAEIQAHLPHLEKVHTSLVVIAGLAEYLGDTLHLAQEFNACSAAQARVISERVKQIASTDSKPTAQTSEQPQSTGDNDGVRKVIWNDTLFVV
jgi:hypothetical protein